MQRTRSQAGGADVRKTRNVYILRNPAIETEAA